MKITKRQLKRIIREAVEQHLNSRDALGWGDAYGIEPEIDDQGIILYTLDMSNPDHSQLIELDPGAPGGHSGQDSIPFGWEVVEEKGDFVTLTTTVKK